MSLSLDVAFDQLFIGKNGISNEGKIGRLLEEENFQEIPIFGSSKARSAFIPDSLNPNCYNYGMEKCGFDVVNFLLEIELQKPKQSPIIIEYNHRSFISQPEHTVNASSFIPNLHHNQVVEFLKETNRMSTRFYIPGLRYFGSYTYYLRYYIKADAGVNKRINKGGNFSNFILEADVFENMVSHRLKLVARRDELLQNIESVSQVISTQERHELDFLNSYLNFTYDSSLVSNFSQLVSSTPRQIILVHTPNHYSEEAGIANKDEMKAFYNALADKHNNIMVIDLSGMLLLDSDYKNSTHLNITGAQAFSEALKRKLKW
ncbi:MAG: hypothetical protein KDC92_00990 [Bacteroidetes bacterium]|nr:hypothetical protein [Bacteroidota bacterium]